MRILLKLISSRDFSYDINYQNKAQGFIYNLIKWTDYDKIHDKSGYKFFCFSNFFPLGNCKYGDKKFFIISSPDKHFIKLLKNKLEDIEKSEINIGEMSFFIDDINIIKTKIDENSKLISSTPIVIRIPEKRYEEYSIPEKFRKKRYVFWRPEYKIKPFILQLEYNLIKKYKEFYKKDPKIENIFQEMIFKKTVVNKIRINNIDRFILGSIWEFRLNFLKQKTKKILEFGIDCGFGERNSFGFGFINKVKDY